MIAQSFRPLRSATSSTSEGSRQRQPYRTGRKADQQVCPTTARRDPNPILPPNFNLMWVRPHWGGGGLGWFSDETSWWSCRWRSSTPKRVATGWWPA